MKKIKSTAIKLWKDESGQGTAEYVLILVAVVALATVFRGKVNALIGPKIADLTKAITDFK